MQNNPNPYSPPRASLEPAMEPAAHPSLRKLLRVLIVVQIVALPLIIGMPERLPADLVGIKERYDTAFLNAYPALILLLLFVPYASLIGLWWEKRWAAWAFLVSSIGGYALQLLSGPQITSDLVALLDSLTDAAVGALLVVLYGLGTFSAPSPDSAEGSEPRSDSTT